MPGNGMAVEHAKPDSRDVRRPSGHRVLRFPAGISQTIYATNSQKKIAHIKQLKEVTIPPADFVHRPGSILMCRI